MTWLIILAAILFLALAGTSWILILVVRQNQSVREDNYGLKLSLVGAEERSERYYQTLRDRDKTIMNLEDAAVALHLEHQKERDEARGMFERVITRMLQRQMVVENIAGGGGSADPEDEYHETPGQLVLVKDG